MPQPTEGQAGTANARAGWAAGMAALVLAALGGLVSAGEPAPPRLTSATAYERLSIVRQPWQYRHAEGANCLYLVLRQHGRDADHEALAGLAAGLGRPTTLDDLHGWAAERGLSTRVARPGPAGLDRLPLPAVVHLVAAGDDRYAVLARDAGGAVVLVDGHRADAHAFQREAFLTQWTGEALVIAGPAAAGRRALALLVRGWPVLAGLNVVLLVVYLYGRRRARQPAAARVPAGAPAAVAAGGARRGLVLPPPSGRGFRLDDSSGPGSGAQVVLVLATGGALLAGPGPLARGQDTVTPPSREALVSALVDAGRRWEGLPGLEIAYRVERDLPEGAERSSEHWPWAWAEVLTRVCPSRPGRLVVRCKHPDVSGRFGALEATEDIGCSDGEVVVEAGLGKHGAVVARLSPAGRRPPAAFGYDWYFRYLGNPLGLARDEGAGTRSLTDAREDWLPEVLARLGEEYRVRPGPEPVDGTPCWVLERPGRDVVWVEAGARPRLRQRQTFWADGGGPRRLVTYGEPREVAPGVELPTRLQVVLYGAPWDEPGLRGREVSRLKVTVSKASAEPLKDEAFRLKIGPMMEVVDLIDSDEEFDFHNRIGSDPFAAVVGRLEPAPGGPGWGGRLGRWAVPASLGMLALAGLVSLGVVRQMRSRAA